ncbi:MAG: thioredoxin family protein [Bacteroidetes bacterium]|nr:thioredoxin family protein [Bacteroidota bacterium]
MAYKFTKEKFESYLTYKSYRGLLDRLAAGNKTTGDIQDESHTGPTKLNIARMNRIDKTTVLTEELKMELDGLKHRLNFIVITEGWCGDTANIVPVINAISEYSGKLCLRLVLRDDNPEIMDEYLTNGSRSIPVLIVLGEDFAEKAVWGPRPAELQKYVMEEKKKPGNSPDELKKNIQLWYLGDKTLSTQKEILSIIKKVNTN